MASGQGPISMKLRLVIALTGLSLLSGAWVLVHGSDVEYFYPQPWFFTDEVSAGLGVVAKAMLLVAAFARSAKAILAAWAWVLILVCEFIVNFRSFAFGRIFPPEMFTVYLIGWTTFALIPATVLFLLYRAKINGQLATHDKAS